jgi:proline iminopeptidase
MMASGKEYGAYANEVLAKQMKPELAEIRAPEAKRFYNLATWNYFYLTFYKEHLCRLEECDGVNRALNM